MMKLFTAVICITTIVFASPAFAYKRDVQPKSDTETQEAPSQEQYKYDYKYESGGGSGRGLMMAGYVCLALGGAAAIAGTTIVTATDKRLAGAIVGASGAALGLAGTLMIVFGGESGYGLGPSVDPSHGTYGLAMAGKF